MGHTGLFPVGDGWCLSSEGAAVLPNDGLAVVADLHLGYEWTRGSKGDQIPAHSLMETMACLDRLFAKACITRLVIAGDMVESPLPCTRTWRDVAELQAQLTLRGVELTMLPGNHDPRPARNTQRTLEVRGWTIAHGHEPIDAARTISGHDHPVLSTFDTVARCFLVSPSAIILPAFTNNAAGLNVAGEVIPGRWKCRGLRCIVAAGEDLLDFGPLDSLHHRLRNAVMKTG